MKWWVGLLALLIVLAFAAVGQFYVRTFVTARPYGIILFVANGFDLTLLEKARQRAIARGQTLQIDRLDKIGVLEVQGLNQIVPDESAASTALACGRRVQNGLVSVTVMGKRLDTLVYAAQRAGRATGLVTTSDLTAPTPLAFYGVNQGDPEAPYRAAAELVDSSGFNIILGAGGKRFYPAHVLNEEGRRDGKNLVREAEKRGYDIVHNAQELDQIPAWRTRRMLGVFCLDSFIFSGLRSGATSLPTLASMTRQAIRCLQYNIGVKTNIGGYFLVVEHGLVASASRNNWSTLALSEADALDSAVGTALEYAGNKSLVLITNNFSLGALDASSATLNAPENPVSSSPSYDWLTGPGGTPLTLEDKLWKNQNNLKQVPMSWTPLVSQSPAVHFLRQAEITTAPSWLGAHGMGSERFSGFYTNSDLFNLVREQF